LGTESPVAAKAAADLVVVLDVDMDEKSAITGSQVLLTSGLGGYFVHDHDDDQSTCLETCRLDIASSGMTIDRIPAVQCKRLVQPVLRAGSGGIVVFNGPIHWISLSKFELILYFRATVTMFSPRTLILARS
jgi:hypothetical protein